MELEKHYLERLVLIGAVLVFFMQSGFAMVETGFTRAKNAGNIIMKNLVDFCLGTVVFILLGYGLLVGPSCGRGIYRDPHPGHVWGGFASFDWSSFFFQLVFLRYLCHHRLRGHGGADQVSPPIACTPPSSAW